MKGICVRSEIKPLKKVLLHRPAREQWNDGSNTLCIAPGKIVVYERNDVTNAILRDEGINVLEMPSAELSRGRGGPRCMSMPIIRAE